MTAGLPIKKLFKLAILSSIILMGALSIAPNVINSKPITPSGKFFTMFFSLVLSMFVIWCINIAILIIIHRFDKSRYAVYKRYIISYIICIAIIYFSRNLINSFVHDPSSRQAHLTAVFILTIILDTIVLILQDLVILRQSKSTIELENAALKLKNAEATNQQLKQQVHPHFLFNSLSTLKTLIRKDPVQAEDYLLKLSDFLRASFLATTPNTVTLADELAQCLNYLEMQKMRFGRSLQYTIRIPQDVQDSVSVPVFSLLLLLENAIKHNKLIQEEPLHILIEYADGRIITSNNLQPKTIDEASTGLGLENLAERYRILTGDEVIITNTGETFSVSIKAITHDDSDHRR